MEGWLDIARQGGTLEAALLGSEGGPGLMVWAFAAMLGVTRAAAAFAITPFLSYLGLRGLLRIVVSGALAIPAILGLPDALLAARPDALTLLSLVLKEAVIGVALGLLMGLPFWAAEMAGAAIDQQRFAVSAQTTAPDQRTETSVIGLFFGLLYLGYLISVDGHLMLLEILYGSYQLWPALSLLPSAAPPMDLALGFLQSLMTLALLLAGPIIFLLLLSDLGVAAMARFAPQMNAMMLAMQVKSLLIAGAILLYLGLMFRAFGGQLDYFADLREIVGGGLR